MKLIEKMAAKAKDSIMASVLAGETHLLVATTVIEVGVDVPDASVMVIYNAERFGLSQLHQLRGRVGRSDIKSYCFFPEVKRKGKLPTLTRKRCKYNPFLPL